MSLWNLTLAEMLGITSSLLAKDGLRARFEEHPLLAEMLPSLEHVHAQAARVAPAPEDDAAKEYSALSQEGAVLDAEQHDRRVRGIYHLFESLAELATTPDAAARFRTLSSRLLPQGLATMQQSWQGEAGNAARVAQMLQDDPSLRSELTCIKLPGNHTLCTEVDALVRVGLRLGAIEARRAELKAASNVAAPDDGIPAVSFGVARRDWFEVVDALCKALRMPRSSVPTDLRNAALGLVDEAERKADLRARQRRPRTEEKPTPAADAAPHGAPSGRNSVPPSPVN